MSEHNEHDRIIELLERARRPEGEITRETLEETLGWLAHAGMPEEEASEALRERVRAIARTPPAPRRPWLARVFAGAPSVPRRVLLGALPLGAAAILLLVLLLQAPTSVLARALDAMAKVKTAHCTGWSATYRFTGSNGRPIPGKMRVEWWYKAPDRYRCWAGADVRGWGVVPGVLIVNGHRNVFISTSHVVPPLRYSLPYSFRTRYLSPLDFFSSEGIIHRAEFEKAARVTTAKGVYRGRKVHVVTIDALERQQKGTVRNHWTLTIDPATDRIIQSEQRSDWRENGGTWQTMDREVLDRFEYDVPVKDSLFQARFPSHMLRSDLKKPGD
jgi:hypothetical protein